MAADAASGLAGRGEPLRLRVVRYVQSRGANARLSVVCFWWTLGYTAHAKGCFRSFLYVFITFLSLGYSGCQQRLSSAHIVCFARKQGFGVRRGSASSRIEFHLHRVGLGFIYSRYVVLVLCGGERQFLVFAGLCAACSRALGVVSGRHKGYRWQVLVFYVLIG